MSLSWKEFKEYVDVELLDMGLSEDTQLELIEVLWPDKKYPPEVYEGEGGGLYVRD